MLNEMRKFPSLNALCIFQFAVFYDGEECLGSAKITNAGPSDYVEVEVASKSNK